MATSIEEQGQAAVAAANEAAIEVAEAVKLTARQYYYKGTILPRKIPSLLTVEELKQLKLGEILLMNDTEHKPWAFILMDEIGNLKKRLVI